MIIFEGDDDEVLKERAKKTTLLIAEFWIAGG